MPDELSPETPLDPAAQLRLVAEQQARTSAALAPDERLIFGAWGVAWTVGFGAIVLVTSGRLPLPTWSAFALFALLLVGAGVVTAVHAVRAGRGVTGTSARTGAMYGWGWVLGFAMLPAVVLGAQRLGAPPEAVALLWPAVSALVVGLLYVGGAAAWDDPVQFAVGAWIIVTAGIGCLLGLQALYLVMCLAGGGGFLVAAAWFTVRRRRTGAVAAASGA